MILRTFKSRVLLGALLWTAGLLPIAHVVAIALFHRFPSLFVRDPAHGALLLIVAVGLLVVGALLLQRSLSPFRRLHASLSAVRSGREPRVTGDYPREVQPLVDELNALLDQREQAVRRALRKAGDFAHGLKTPLAVLTHEAERVAAAGQPELAATIVQQLERMRRQVERHLALSRAAASGPGGHERCSVAESAEALARALARLHEAGRTGRETGRGIAIDVRVPADHSVRGRREELEEMLGNLLDNACKWARSRVLVTSERGEGTIAIFVDDDGPGLAPELRESVLQRGVRADETAPGTGLGLAIVRELAEHLGGSIALEGSPLGGVRARLLLPG